MLNFFFELPLIKTYEETCTQLQVLLTGMIFNNNNIEDQV